MTRFTLLITLLVVLPLFAAVPQTNGVVASVNGAPQLLIAAAGSTPGANGTFFRSDIMLVNFANPGQRVQLRWLPSGGGAGATTEITMPATNQIRSEDFVTDYFGIRGLGSILITGITNTGAVDPTARLYASSRIWTPQPGTNGTTSQSMDVVPVSASAFLTGAIFGVRRDQRYRLNVGIVNLDPTNEATFLVGDLYIPPTPVVGEFYLVMVPPMSMQQISLSVAASRTEVHIRRNSFMPVAWVAYGSSVDNVTGDAWIELALLDQ